MNKFNIGDKVRTVQSFSGPKMTGTVIEILGPDSVELLLNDKTTKVKVASHILELAP